VNATARALAGTDAWIPAIPTGRKKETRAQTQARWDTMRKEMGSRFEALQQAIVRAKPKFKPGNEGEPDLFCYTPDGAWFFAEAKTDADALRLSQRKWFGIAEDVLSRDGQVFLCRVVKKGSLRAASRSKHTERWVRMMGI
jgi:hypothetical protein